MPYEIKYRSKWDGKEHVLTYSGNQAGAEGWARSLASDNGCKVVAEYVNNGPHTDYSGRRDHIISIGNDK